MWSGLAVGLHAGEAVGAVVDASAPRYGLVGTNLADVTFAVCRAARGGHGVLCSSAFDAATRPKSLSRTVAYDALRPAGSQCESSTRTASGHDAASAVSTNVSDSRPPSTFVASVVGRCRPTPHGPTRAPQDRRHGARAQVHR